MTRSTGRSAGVVIAGLMVLVGNVARADGGGSVNFVPELTLSYTDPVSGEPVECGDGCRRFTVPAGTHLEVRVQVHREGDGAGGDEATWDLWFNQPNHPWPGLRLVPCFDPSSDLDRSCWQALHDQVDRESWDVLIPDIVCVPSADEASCRDRVVKVVMDPAFEGARRQGVYHFAVWVDRFSLLPETDEFDNVVGPIRVTVEPAVDGQDTEEDRNLDSKGVVADADHAGRVETDASPSIVIPSTPMPYAVAIVSEEVDTVFNLTSKRSQRLLEFAPACAGTVNVEVMQTGVYENMTVQVRKVSTGEVLIEASGRGRLRLQGAVDNFDLRDDHDFEVAVTPGQGARGIRGSIRVSYPARVRYMVDQTSRE